MNLRRSLQTEEDVDLNITPLIDVVFLLLIFFMVTSTFKKEAELTVDLPQASADPALAEEHAIEVIITDDGNYLINKQLIVEPNIQTIVDSLRAAAGNDRNPKILISADAKADHQFVVNAMDAARQAGFVRLRIATETPQ